MSRAKFTCRRAVCRAALFMCLGSASALAHGHCAASSASPKNVAMSSEIGLDSAFRAALAAGNAELAASYLSDDVIMYEEGEAEQSKAEYVGHHLPADIAFSQATQFVVLKHSEKIPGDVTWTATGHPSPRLQQQTNSTYLN